MFLSVSPLIRYGVAVLAVVLSLILTDCFASLYHQGTVFVMLGGVMVAAWFGGRGPGWLATLLSTTGALYFIAPPAASFSVSGPADAIRLALFVGVCALIVKLTDSQQRANLALMASKDTLEQEVLKRRQAEETLRGHTLLLEDTVCARTAELQKLNDELRQEVDRRMEVEDALRESNDHLEAQVRERTHQLTQTNDALQEKNQDLEKFYDLVVGRELKLIAAEKEVERLTAILSAADQISSHHDAFNGVATHAGNGSHSASC